MQRNLVASLAIGLGLTISTSALAQSPDLGAVINAEGQSYDLSNTIVKGTDSQGNTTYNLPNSTIALGDGSILTSNFSADSDPSITYSFAVSNPSSSPKDYAFDMVFPIVPTNIGPDIAQLSGSVSDGGGGGLITLTHIAPFAALQQATGVDINGIDHSLGLDVGPDKTYTAAPTQSFSYGGFSKTGTSSYIIYALDVHLHFTLSGNGDSVSFNGRVAVNGTPAQQSVTPEPGSLAMLGAFGVCASGLIARRRNRR